MSNLGCNNVITESFGTITSPGNNQVPYPNSQVCTWTIQVAQPGSSLSQPVTLAVNRFDVMPDDFLQVRMTGRGDELQIKINFIGKLIDLRRSRRKRNPATFQRWIRWWTSTAFVIYF